MISIIRILLHYSFLHYIIRFLKEFNRKRIDLNKSLNNLSKYWHAELSSCTPNNKNILVELLYEHPASNHLSCVRGSILKKYYKNAKIIGLLEYSSNKYLIKFMKIFQINAYITVYRFFDLFNWLLAIRAFFKSDMKYNLLNGIKINIEGIEVGDLIYDQYLRYKNIPTLREVTFEYKIYVLSNMYIYYRYKNILLKSNITDIVLTHNVYADFGLLAKAAGSIDKNIIIWTLWLAKPTVIHRQIAAITVIKKPLYYTERYGKVVEEYLQSKENVKYEFDAFFKIRSTGKDTSNFDIANVYKNLDISNVCKFKDIFSYAHKNKHFFIFSHAFVDAVRYAEWSLYSDYYTWLEQTLIILVKKSKIHNIYIKPHPSEYIYKCDVTVKTVIEKINFEYKAEFIYLDKKVSNSMVFSLANAIVTCRGSVGFESPCFGVPVITAAWTQYENSTASLISRSISEYKNNLENIEKISKLNDNQVYNAKLCYLWAHKYVFTDAEFLPRGLNIFANDNIEEELKIIDSAYIGAKPLVEQEYYKSLSFMIEKNYENSFSGEIINV